MFNQTIFSKGPNEADCKTAKRGMFQTLPRIDQVIEIVIGNRAFRVRLALRSQLNAAHTRRFH